MYILSMEIIWQNLVSLQHIYSTYVVTITKTANEEDKNQTILKTRNFHLTSFFLLFENYIWKKLSPHFSSSHNYCKHNPNLYQIWCFLLQYWNGQKIKSLKKCFLWNPKTTYLIILSKCLYWYPIPIPSYLIPSIIYLPGYKTITLLLPYL